MHTPTPLQRRIPNALTVARLVMAAAFVSLLSLYQHPDGSWWTLPAATGLFVVAALTDALDGYLARKWNAISVFGRIMDPFADKILVLGAFVLLAGGQFSTAIPSLQDPAELVRVQVTGVLGWMVVVIIARELLVTTIRATLEGRGIDFSASTSGKWKMIAQSVSVPLILLLVAFAREGEQMHRWALLTNDVIASAVVFITVWSGVPYVTRAATAFRGDSSP